MRPCAAKLSDNDLLSLSLMVSFVTPLCEYLAKPPGFLQLLTDLASQVKKSFLLDEPANVNFQTFVLKIGKNIVSNFLPIYTNQFIDSEFLLYPGWFLLAFFLGANSKCHLAVLACFCLEILLVAFRLSFLGVLYSLTFVNFHSAVLILRYATSIIQCMGCGLCFWNFTTLLLVFIPQMFLVLLDKLKNYGHASGSRDENGQFIKKKR